MADRRSGRRQVETGGEALTDYGSGGITSCEFRRVREPAGHNARAECSEEISADRCRVDPGGSRPSLQDHLGVSIPAKRGDRAQWVGTPAADHIRGERFRALPAIVVTER